MRSFEQPSFDERWSGLRDEINTVVAEMLDAGHDARGLAVAMTMAGAEAMTAAQGPGGALGMLEVLLATIRHQNPRDAAIVDFERGGENAGGNDLPHLIGPV